MSHEAEHVDGQVPDFLRRDELFPDKELKEPKEPQPDIERDMEFVVTRMRGLSTDPVQVQQVQDRPGPDHYAPKFKPLPSPAPSPKYKIANPEAEKAAQRIAQQAKDVVTQTSSVVRKAIAELQRELKELDEILVAHEAQSHDMIDDHLRVSTEAAGAVIVIRENFEVWRDKVRMLKGPSAG